MDRDQLLNDLREFGSADDKAAEILADRGDRDALPAILASIIRDCGWEVVPDRKITAFIRLADVAAVPLLVAALESLDEAELEDDAGDVGDEFWRIQTAVRRMLLGVGRQGLEPVQKSLATTTNRFARECLEQVAAQLEATPPA